MTLANNISRVGALRMGPGLVRLLSRHSSILFGALAILVIGCPAMFYPLVTSRDPNSVDLRARLQPPLDLASAHILGTDGLGRDLLIRTLAGARVSLVVAASAVLVSSTVGVSLGLISGYYGRPFDQLVMRAADVQLAFPMIILAIAIIGVLGPSPMNLILVLSLGGWVIFARTVRGVTLSIAQKEYVQAARAIGASDARILLSHVLPNTLSPLVVLATFQMAAMIALESALSFFGLGIQPPTPSWGAMLAEGRDYLDTAWWVASIPGTAIMATILGINLLGEGLRDILDPEAQRR